MMLFHGGTDRVGHPRILTGDQGRDFGFAFYTTDIREQAERWALRRARYRNRMARQPVDAIVREYEFDEAALSLLAVKRFPEPSPEWLDFVVANRSSLDFRHGFDVVVGKIANDRVGEIVSYVVAGVMRREDAVERLRFQQINNQWAFCTEKALAHLKFIRGYGVRNG